MRFIRNKMFCLSMVASMAILPGISYAQSAQIRVDAGKVMNTIPVQMYGSCIEDVNHEIYGGLYDQRLFGESFEEPGPSPAFKGWTTLGGYWSEASEAVRVAPGAGDKMVKENLLISDGIVEADVMVREGFNAGLLLRLSREKIGADNFYGYEVSLNPNSGTLVLGKHKNNWRAIREVKAPVRKAEWIHLKVEMKGSRLLIYAGNPLQALIDYHDTDTELSNGKIALRTFNADASFKNIKVTRFGKVNRLALESVPVAEVSGQWTPLSKGKGSTFRIDKEKSYSGSQSQLLEQQGSDGMTGIINRGLNRWGIAVKKEQQLQGHIYLCAEGLKGPVRVLLQSADGQRSYAVQEIGKIAKDWKRYDFNFIPNATDPKAQFVLFFEGEGRLWVDQAVLMSAPEDQFSGLPVRADIAEMMQKEGLNFLRYGGTMVNAAGYRWKKMIGDRDRRMPYKGHWYPYSTNGFGIEDFLQYCEAAGFEAAFAINIEETAEDAADLVEYLKGDRNTIWGKKRIENGHPEPYAVKYIEIGNEEVIFNGDVKSEYEHYINRFLVLHKAMQAKDPSLKFVNSAWWRPESENMKMVFNALDGKADYWDLHTDADPADAGLKVDRTLSQMKELFLKWNPNTLMKCAIFEENGGLHNQQRALGHASTLNAVRRHGDFVLTSCAANALQALGQNDNGWDQGQIFYTPSEVWGMPPFYAQQMAAEHHQPLRLDTEVEGDLDVSATVSEDGKVLVLHVVNFTDGQQSTKIDLRNFAAGRLEMQLSCLAGNPEEENTREQPARISPQTENLSVEGSTFTQVFKPNSYTILRLKK